MRFDFFSRTQLRALSWWSDSSPYRDLDAVICDGAVRSGKTLCMGISFICWAMRRFDNERFGICGKAKTSIRRNLIEPLLPVLRDIGFEVTDLVSKGLIEIAYKGRRNSFWLFGGKDEGSQSLIQGVTLAGVLMDEVVLMPRSFVEQACARCSVAGSKIWFNCNPESPRHWFYLEWIKKADERRALYIHFSLEDNPSLSKSIIDRYKRMYSGDFYRRFILGEWVLPAGRVYDFFTEEMLAPVPESCSEYIVSCDYGTKNPSSFGLWGRSGGVWYRLREYYYDARREGAQKTDGEYVAALRELCGDIVPCRVIVDPSAASFIEALTRAGFRTEKAENDVLSGIRLTAELLKSGKIRICRGCDDSLREFYEYRWDEKSGRDAPLKQSDHAMDDIRYFAAGISRSAQPIGAVWVER
ncbi:MAG: PBSX family phage terminase large subunit [Oscillospiraceae bacterium]